MIAGSPEHKRAQRAQWRREMAEIKRNPYLSPEDRALIGRIDVLARDAGNAEMVRLIAYWPLGPLSIGRVYAVAVCQLRGFGNLRGDRNPALT